MTGIHEIPPIMVLVEDEKDRQLYRFRGKRWGLYTLVAGLGFFAGLFAAHDHHAPPLLQIVLAVFGVLMLYSTVFSSTADQWLRVDGSNRSIAFTKNNLYGRVEWQRPGAAFSAIRVFRPSTRGGRAFHWSIVLTSREGPDLSLGENDLGSLHRERALAMAHKIGQLAGIEVVET